MREKPILFSGPMVRAILEGRKTQTRRVVMPQPEYGLSQNVMQPLWWNDLKPCGGGVDGPPEYTYDVCKERKCPYGVAGDCMWVKENYAAGVEWDDEKPGEIDPLCGGADIWYMADGPKPVGYGKTRPSIFMPRWASRITLEVTGVWVGRVQDISEEDVLSEGTEQVAWESKDYREYTCMWRDCASAIRTRRRTEFRRIWDSINAKRGYGWDTNPWVFVYEFRRIA